MDLIQAFEKNQIRQKFPDIRPGDTVRIHQKIKELIISETKTKKKEAAKEKEKIQVFEGIVLYVRGGKGLNGTFCVRKVSNGVGVEKIFPIHLPSIVKIEVVKRSKVRRAKLFYLRRREQKAARLREKKISEELKKTLLFESEELKRKTEENKKQKKEEKKAKKAKAAESKKETKESTKPQAKK